MSCEKHAHTHTHTSTRYDAPPHPIPSLSPSVQYLTGLLHAVQGLQPPLLLCGNGDEGVGSMGIDHVNNNKGALISIILPILLSFCLSVYLSIYLYIYIYIYIYIYFTS